MCTIHTIQETSPPNEHLHYDTINSSHSFATDLYLPSKFDSSKSSVLTTQPQSRHILKDMTASHTVTESTSSNMPLYAVPDEVKSKVSCVQCCNYTRSNMFIYQCISERDQISCPSKEGMEHGEQLLIVTENEEVCCGFSINMEECA